MTNAVPVAAAVQPGVMGPVVDLIVKGGALGLALLLTWMSYKLFDELLKQPRIDSKKAMLVVFFVFGTFGSLVGGALLHSRLTHPKVSFQVVVSPTLEAGDVAPQILAATVKPVEERRKFQVEVGDGELVTIEVTRLIDRAREATRLEEILARREAAAAEASTEMGAGNGI